MTIKNQHSIRILDWYLWKYVTVYTMKKLHYYFGINSVEICSIWITWTTVIKILISQSWFDHHEIWTRSS